MSGPLKVLVRRWVHDRGCLYLRSAEMSNQEAIFLLEASLATIDGGGLGEEDAHPHEIDLKNYGRARAFVLLSHEPDPDHPERMTRPFRLVYLPEPENFIREAVAELLLNVPWPAAVQAINGGDWHVVREGEPAAPLEKWWIRVLYRSMEHWRLVVGLVVVGVVAACLWGAWRALNLGEVRPVSSFPGTASQRSNPSERDAEELKEGIRGLLGEPWAQRRGVVLHAEKLGDRELLEAFGRLFKRPASKDLRLNVTDARYFDAAINDPRMHESPLHCFHHAFSRGSGASASGRASAQVGTRRARIYKDHIVEHGSGL